MDKAIKQFGIWIIIAVLFFYMGSGMAWRDGTEVRTGVLSKRGKERCLEKTSPTANYLSSQIPAKTFVIVPLEFDKVYSAVEKGEIEFVLANPSIYVEIEHRFEASRIATLKNFRLGKAYTVYGGVVFCKADRGDIRRLIDLKGKTLMIVDDLAFAGWTLPLNYQPVHEYLKELKLSPYKDLGGITLMDVIRSHLKKRILAQGQGGTEFQPAGILKYVEDLKLGPNTEIGQKDFFEIASSNHWYLILITFVLFIVMAGSLLVFFKLNRKIQTARVKLQLEVEEHKRIEKLLMGSEEKFSKAFHHSPLLMTISSIEDSKFIDVNENFVCLTGYSKTEAIGATSVDLGLISKKDRDKMEQKIITNGRVEGMEITLHKKNKKKLFCLYFGEIIMVAGKQRLLSIVNDISERKKSEEALRQHERQLFQTQKMESLGNLVSVVAHKINNPINLILFNISVLQNIWRDFQPVMEQQAKIEPNRKYGGLTYSYIEKKLDHLLSDTSMASCRIANIVSGLKDFARQTDIADKKPMQINEAVNNAIKLSQTTLRKSQVTLDLRLAHNLPLIKANMQSIEQIILNLIINAIQSIEHDEGKIRIITEAQREKNKIIVSISDNGKGINTSLSERIFDPFITDKLAQGGTGLGLSVTYNLVKAHDGEISFKSLQGEGTIFTVNFTTKTG